MSVKQITQRIDTFDLLRGFFILVIIIDHLQRWPGIFDWITGQGRLWVSAAEGFIFISGIMIGLVRGRGNAKLPLWTVTKKLWWRAFVLYSWMIITALLSLVIVSFWHRSYTPFPPGYDSYSATTTMGAILETVTLRGTFGWSVFLVQYAVYLFFAPAFVYALRKKLWWLGLLISGAVWVYGFGDEQFLLSWQFLFFIGATVGYYYPDLQKHWKAFQYHAQTTAFLSVLAVATLVASVTTIFGWPVVKQDWSLVTLSDMLQYRTFVDPFFVRSELRPIHLAMSLLWFYVLYALFRRFEPQIQKYAGWLLMRFGQNSLSVYIMQGFVVILVSGAIAQTNNIITNAVITALSVLFIWWLAGRKLLYKIIPR